MKKLVLAGSTQEYNRWRMRNRVPDGESVEVRTMLDVTRANLEQVDLVLVGDFWLNPAMQHTCVREVVAEESRIRLIEQRGRPKKGAGFVVCKELWVGVRYVQNDDVKELWIGVVPFAPLRIWWRK